MNVNIEKDVLIWKRKRFLLNLSSLLVNIVMAVLTAVTALTEINGIINSISFVVPFLLLAVIGTGIFSIIYCFNSPTRPPWS